MSYLYKLFIAICLTIYFNFVYSESNCGTSLCISTAVIKPGETVNLSWHKSDNPKGLQISLLYGDNADKTDCHELQGERVLRSWQLKNGEEEYGIKFDSVNFEIENKKFVFLVEYLSSSFCMMAPSGPKGLGTSYIVFDPSMPVKMNEKNNENNSGNNNTNGNGNTNSNGNSNTDGNNSGKSSNNNSNDTNDQNGKSDNPKSDKDNKSKDDKDGFFNTFTTILTIIISIIVILILVGLLLFYSRKMKGKDKNSNADSLKQNSTTRILSPNLTDDAFAEDSVYSAVNINNAIPPISHNQGETYPQNVSVESFNSSNSQSGLISRHEAKMIAERFRCELQNPLNNEVDDASSIKEKEESV